MEFGFGDLGFRQPYNATPPPPIPKPVHPLPQPRPNHRPKHPNPIHHHNLHRHGQHKPYPNFLHPLDRPHPLKPLAREKPQRQSLGQPPRIHKHNHAHIDVLAESQLDHAAGVLAGFEFVLLEGGEPGE